MTSISTLTPTQYKELYGSQAVLTGQPTMVDTAVSVLSQNNTSSTSSSSSDGADDGKISFWSGIKSAIKGVGKTIINAVKSLNPLKPENWWNIIKTAGCVALAIWFPPAGFAMACIAGAKGLVTVGKGAVAASNATTDAEAEAAWENIGSGSFQVAMSVVGAKAALKAMKATPGSAMGEVYAKKGATMGDKVRAFGEDVKEFGRGGTQAWKDAALADGKTLGYKSAGFADKIKEAYGTSDKTGVISQRVDAVIKGTKNAFKETRLGKAYDAQKIGEKGLKENGAEKISSKATRLKDAAKEVHKENQLARQVTRDVQKHTEGVKAAEKNVNDFKAKYDTTNTVDVDGVKYYKSADGTQIKVSDFDTKVTELNKAVETAKNAEAASVKAANAAKEAAEKNVNDFKAKYDTTNTVDVDGVKYYKSADGTQIKVSDFETEVNKLSEAVETAEAQVNEVNAMYDGASEAAELRSVIQEKIAKKQAELKNATGDTAKQLAEEIKTAKDAQIELSIQSRSAVSDAGSKAVYDTLTGRTSLFKTASANWKDAAVASHYDSIFATTKPAISLLFEEANSGSDIAKIQLQQLGYNVY